jgi:outer membrane receptor for ferrienterochelin and colicin
MLRFFASIVLVLATLGVGSVAWAGTIAGVVTDLYTGEPIPAAKVLVEGTDLLTATGKNGTYAIHSAPAGSVRVTCGALSYTKQTKSVTVPAAGSVGVNFVLEIGAVVEAEEVVVHEKKEVVDESPQTSAHSFTAEEIQDNAGAFEDVAKMMKKLPGVVQSSSFTADMYVRGAQNWENMIVIDNLLLMNPYHFGIGLSVINTELVQDVTFYAGGFPAKYPFATGSVLDVTYKDGNRERVDGKVSVSMLSSSAEVTGPGGDSITWILSARRSYYDLMVNALGYQDVPVPVFSDFFFKCTWEPGEKNRFELFTLRSEDGIKVEIKEENPSSVDEGEIAFTNLTQVYGIDWQLFPTSWLLSTTTVTHQIMNLDANLTSQSPLYAHSQVNATYAHHETEFAVHPRNILTIGGDYGLVGVDLDAQIRLSAFVLGANFDTDLAYFDTEFDHEDPIEIWGGFAQDEWELVKGKLRSNVGMRMDHYESDGEGWMFSPRASLSWTVVPDTVIKAAWGIYPMPPFNILATDEKWGNPDLRPQTSTHHVLGIEQGITEHGMLRVEGYYILFDDMQFQKFDAPEATLEALVGYAAGQPPIADIEWQNSGYGKAYGLEIFAQKKLSGKWDGWLAYTLAEVLYNDGMGMYGWFHPFQDQRHTLNLVANYRPWDHWTFSATFGLYSGKPYTPVITWEKQNPGSLFQFWTPVQGEINSSRLPTNHQLDVRMERSWDLSERVDLTAFFEIYNVYNARNVFDYWYAENEGIDRPERRTIHDLPILPYGGVKVEF